VYWEIVLTTTIAIACVSMVGRWFMARNRRRRREAELAQHSITPEQLSQALAKRPRLPLFDLREPLDVVANSEIIPGATRISPYRVLENPWLIPKEKEAIIYCTCSEDETNIVLLERLLAMGFSKVKFLKGGLEGGRVPSGLLLGFLSSQRRQLVAPRTSLGETIWDECPAPTK
jgi:rhodanese-related sulfurtransferase